MLIAAYENCSLRCSERDQVVVSWVGRGDRRRILRIAGRCRAFSEPSQDGATILSRDAAAKLGIGERSPQFLEQGGGDDEFEFAAFPCPQDASSVSGRRENPGDDDIRVENRPHVHSARDVARLVLRLDGKRGGVVLGQLVLGP